MIKHIYTVFIGVLLATMVGVGVAAFYSGLRAPEYPIRQEAVDAKCSPTAEEIQYEKDHRVYVQQNKIYSRNVSMVVLILSVVVLVTSLTILSRLQVISDGLLLGGLLTQVYSVIRGFESEDSKFRFLVVLIAMTTSLIVGYLKFIKKSTTT